MARSKSGANKRRARRRREWALTVRCPECGAEVGDECDSPRPHSQRVQAGKPRGSDGS